MYPIKESIVWLNHNTIQIQLYERKHKGVGAKEIYEEEDIHINFTGYVKSGDTVIVEIK